MSNVLSGEMRLAEAVIALAIKDVLEGSAVRREQARDDIANGLLDYWLEVVCDDSHDAGALRDALRGLAGRRKRIA